MGAPRISKLLEERRDKIQGDLERAEQTRTQAERELAEYREQLAKARQESNGIIEEARTTAERFAPRSRRGPSARPPPPSRRPRTRSGPSGTGSSRSSVARSARSRSSSRVASSEPHWMPRRISG
jgi:hypothetical protein